MNIDTRKNNALLKKQIIRFARVFFCLWSVDIKMSIQLLLFKKAVHQIF